MNVRDQQDERNGGDQRADDNRCDRPARTVNEVSARRN